MSSLQNNAADPRCVTKLRSSRPESTTHAPCHFIASISVVSRAYFVTCCLNHRFRLRVVFVSLGEV